MTKVIKLFFILFIGIVLISCSGGSEKANKSPLAEPLDISATKDTPVQIALPGNYSNNNSISYIIIQPPENGQLSGSAPDLIYTPNNGFTGEDAFTYTITDGRTSSPPAIVTIHVTVCDIADGIPDHPPDQVVLGNDNRIYMLSTVNKKIYRWSLDQNYHLNPIDIYGTAHLMAYSAVDHRLYLGYDSGMITRIDLNSGIQESPFASTPLPPHGLAIAGDYVLAADASGSWYSENTHYIFDRDGNLVTIADRNKRSSEYTWNPVNSRLYFFRDGTTPNDLHYEEINQITGLITDSGQTPYNGDYIIEPPIRVSMDGTTVLLGSGDMYDANTLEYVGTLPIDPVDAAWLSNGLLTIRTAPDGRTLLEQRGPDYTIYNIQYLDGEPFRILEWAQGFVVITLIDGQPIFFTYVPTDDSDNDGLINSEDDFPMDPAASIDTDGDGYPDAWNPGKSEADSTTGLILDSFPNDSDCQLPEHGLPDDPTVCDFTNGIPAYKPDQVVLGSDNVVYMLSTANKRIYRWSLDQDDHLTPIDVDGAAHLMAYSATDHILYLGYDSVAITRIDLNSGIQESPFVATPLSPYGLVVAGDYILAADASGFSDVLHVFDRNGTLITESGFFDYSKEYAWNPVNGRIYYIEDVSNPDDIYYEVIDQTTGLITGSGNTPYYNDFVIKPPIRASKDGTTVLLGSGDMYDADTLEYTGSLPIDPVDAVWMSDGSLTLRPAPDGRSLLEQWRSDYTLYNAQYFDGEPLRIFEWSQGFVVITLVDGQPAFFSYVPTDDGDGDGVINSEDAFPLDPAASMDTDGDGYPDAWNPGKSETDSTTGLVLDSFPDDSACQLPEHALPGDPTVCDIDSGIPDYTPDQVVLGSDNVVYLLSTVNERIYRWSLDQDDHLNPIDIDGAAYLMAYSAVDHRLYIGYDSGAITRIDLNSGIQESSFATTPLSTHGLAIAGDYILAADASGRYSNMHYIFNRDGIMLTHIKSEGFSSEYAWNPVNSRMYFFNDITSPSRIYYEDIDQITGLISTDDVYTPYFPGDNTIKPLIRVSMDGTTVLLGSGDRLDANTVAFIGSLPINIVDAAWMSDGFLTIRTALDGRTLLEHWRSDLTIYNAQYFDGEPLRVFEWPQGFAVITLIDGQPAFFSYVPTDDRDNDGIINSEDAFPLDPAASVDTDGDGYPNAWNPGKSEADSTTGLILDSFPDDSACQLPEHGLPGDPTICDIAGGIQDYTPDEVVLGSDNIVYLLSTENERIYRWSPDQNDHLNPIDIDGAAHLMAYSAADHRLYLGYDSGVITRIDLSSDLQESFFAATQLSLNGLATAGGYVFAVDESGSYNTHYIFDPDGNLMTSDDWKKYSSEYAWNPVNNRIYFFRDDTIPNDLHYEEIDQITGLITDSGETPYHGEYMIKPPIRVSKNGTTVLLGSGDMYDADTMKYTGSLPIDPVDAAWMSDGLLTIRTALDGSTVLEQLGSDYTLYDLQYFDGEPLRVLEGSQGFTVITLVDGQPAFYNYVPTDDGDDDGVINSEDAFPLDVAASIDSDGDGYPDFWNTGYSGSDSTTGLVLDSFPYDMGCQRPEHGIDGECDFNRIIPTDGDSVCESDDVTGIADNGTIAFDFPVSDFVPLCSGWIILSDTSINDQIEVVHAFDGRIAMRYKLISKPQYLFFDETSKTLYVSLKNTREIAKINLAQQSVSYFDIGTDSSITDMANGPDGTLLVKAGFNLRVFSKTSDSLLGSWYMTGDMIVYNGSRDEIILTVKGSSTIYRYSFSLAEGVSLLQSSQDLANRAQDLDLSPDNNHLAFTTYYGNDPGSYTIYDIDPSDLDTHNGFWDIGAYPISSAFSLNSGIFVSKNDYELLIYSVADYSLLDSVAISSNCEQVEVSRGNRIAFALSGDSYSDPKTSTIEWLIYQ